MLRRAGRFLILVACLPLLVACSPAQPGFVAAEGDSLVLRMVSSCKGVAFARVGVKYAEEDKTVDELQGVWQATVKTGASLSEVTLFAESPDVVVDESAAVDLSREVVVWWKEDDGVFGAISGVLGELEPGQVLWGGGVESRQEFDRNEPARTFGC